MPTTFSRRDLFNRIGGAGTAIRPPWSRGEEEFTESCTRCDACLKACPERIIVRGRGGFPVLEFARGGCTFCGACADICAEGAFVEERDSEPWPLKAIVCDACLEHRGISCRACESWCEPRAIRFRPALGGRTDIRIDTENCTGCGACVAPCPQNAINVAAPQKEGIAA